jgi:hypothetical protein
MGPGDGRGVSGRGVARGSRVTPGAAEAAGAAVTAGAKGAAGRLVGALLMPAVVVLALVMPAGCDRAVPEHGRTAIEVSDSAGIEIFEVRWDDAPVAATVEPEPEWSTGAPPPGGAGLALHQVRDAALLGDGTLIIAEESTQELIAYDIHTGRQHRWGGRGSGPRQFQALDAISPRGDDRFGAVDSGRRRYLESDRTGELVAEHSLASANVGPSQVATLGRDGAIYAASAEERETSGVMRTSGRVLRLSSPEQSDADTLGRYLGIESYTGPEYMGLLFFGATGVMAADEGGVWIGDTGEPEVAFWDKPGAPARLVRWTRGIDREITEERREALFDELLGHFPIEDSRALEGMRATVQFRDEIPAFEAIVVGEDGAVWIGEYTFFLIDRLEVRRPAQEWLVVHPDRQSVHRVVTPEGFRLLRAGEGFVLGVHRDDLGVESIRRYAVR